MDKWRAGAPLYLRFPALFSHVTRPHATIATVVGSDLELLPRLTAAAAAELELVMAIIADTALRDGADARLLDSATPRTFSSREAYMMLAPPRPIDSDACICWGLPIPTKVEIFSYLAAVDRLSTRVMTSKCRRSIVVPFN